jgi:peptidoglycan/xylan/chitin deacetylase (PgdA/CDA1 family)
MTAILMYHQIAEIPRVLDPLGLAMPPVQFEQQMSYLARNGFVCLTLAEAVQYFQQGKQTPTKSFVLTFDDGYQDIYSTAYPILEKFDFTATVFMVAGQMGSRSNWWGQDEERAGLLMSKFEAREMIQRGLIIGSHTLSHSFLPILDEKAALDEIRGSKLVLQDQLSVEIDYFSYPYSRTNERIEDLVRLVGYTAACAGDLGSWSLFHLWRVPCLRTDSLLSFAIKVSGLYDRRTALRESIPGQILRHCVHAIRNIVPNNDLRGSHE